jgi:hypothetical protein
MADVEKEITENRQRIIALEKNIEEIKQDIKDTKTLIQNHLLHMVPPSFMWIVSILTTLLGILGATVFQVYRGQ